MGDAGKTRPPVEQTVVESIEHETNEEDTLGRIEGRLARIEGLLTDEFLATIVVLQESIRDLKEQDNAPENASWFYRSIGRHD